MRKSRFTEEQMVAILREADRTSVAAAAKKNKVSEQTIYAWRKHFGELEPTDVKRLKALEAENAKLKKLARRARSRGRPDEGDQPTKVVSPQARREQVACLRNAACRATRLRADRGGALDLVLRAAPAGQGRAGDCDDEAAVSAVSALRLPPNSHLSATRGLGHERLAGSTACGARPACSCRGNDRAGASPPRDLVRCRRGAANHVWAYDFVFDACANGQQIKCLTVVDEFTHECLAIDVAGSIRSRRVIDVLARLISVHGAPPSCAPTMVPSSSATRSWSGLPKTHRHRTSILASLGRTAPTNPSTASSATSA